MANALPSFVRSGGDGLLQGDDLAALLARPLLLHLACLDDHQVPYVVPVWFEWQDGAFWVVARARATWAGYLATRPAVGFSVDDPVSGARVVGQGTAVVVERPGTGEAWVPIGRRMAERYRGAAGLTYLEATLGQPRWLIRIAPTAWRTWNGPGWHERYAQP